MLEIHFSPDTLMIKILNDVLFTDDGQVDFQYFLATLLPTLPVDDVIDIIYPIIKSNWL